MAPGFYIKDMQSFKNWKNNLLVLANEFKHDYIFSIFEKKPDFENIIQNIDKDLSGIY